MPTRLQHNVKVYTCNQKSNKNEVQEDTRELAGTSSTWKTFAYFTFPCATITKLWRGAVGIY